MQKLEYLEIHSGYAGENYVQSVNGEIVPGAEYDSNLSWRLLNRYGEQGWELVQHTAGEWILKRPKS